jgi:hypothetical protein
MKLGLVADLRTYRAYTSRFAALLGRPADAVELHLIRSDLARPALEVELETAARWLRDEGVPAIAHHYLDDVVDRLFRRELGLFAADAAPGDAATLERMLRGTARATHAFGAPVRAVVHEGIFARTSTLDAHGLDALREIRTRFLRKAAAVHERCFAPFRAEVRIGLENSPPYAAHGTAVQHFIDQDPRDITARLAHGDDFVLDVSHWFMCADYFAREERGVWGLDLLECGDPYGAWSDVGWVHLSDCTGFLHEDEGLPLFQERSVIDWTRLMPLLEATGAPLVLEIMHSERDFSLIERSVERLRG